ncbi:YbaK/EbsC family protein [Caviibacter abscessus]|uniref:YbaK/EbsC family protein n=1 Tax=Caviibacter abscessus TaxID=1766719 RepID=UPI00082FB112|nr:YbaK/EbsC family protein [Caviibacter abscessus]
MEKMIYDLLKALKIEYEKLEHEPITSVKNAPKLKGQQVKNLVLKAKSSNKIYLVILHDEKSVNLTNLAELLNEKRLSFASEKVLEQCLHCKPGVVTPFGLIYDTENIINVIIDTQIDTNTTVGFHPFINTITLNIQFYDFEKFLKYANHKPIFLNL